MLLEVLFSHPPAIHLSMSLLPSILHSPVIHDLLEVVAASGRSCTIVILSRESGTLLKDNGFVKKGKISMDWVEVLRPAELGSDLAVLAGPQAVAEGGEKIFYLISQIVSQFGFTWRD